jgi:hypothetical protein
MGEVTAFPARLWFIRGKDMLKTTSSGVVVE